MVFNLHSLPVLIRAPAAVVARALITVPRRGTLNKPPSKSTLTKSVTIVGCSSQYDTNISPDFHRVGILPRNQ